VLKFVNPLVVKNKGSNFALRNEQPTFNTLLYGKANQTERIVRCLQASDGVGQWEQNPCCQ
jgi:hypothetical protein